MQSFHNPFQNQITIRYNQTVVGELRLKIYNVLEQSVKMFAVGEQIPGEYDFSWTGKDDFDNGLVMGVYFYQLTVSGKVRIIQKMMKL